MISLLRQKRVIDFSQDNETGILLRVMFLSCRKANGTLPEKPVAVKTIVTSKLVERICRKVWL